MTADRSRPRILLITRNFPPMVGGMERLNWHIADELSHYAEIRVIGPKGSASVRPEAAELTEVPLKPLWRFLLLSAWEAVSVARAWKPDFILAGSGLTAPAACIAGSIAKTRTGTYLHGLDAALKNRIYRALWHPMIRRIDVIIANSKPTADLASAIGVIASRIQVLNPGVHNPQAPQSEQELENFRKRHHLGSGRILLSVGRLTTRKGLREFVQQSLPTIVRDAPDITLAVVGDSPSDSLFAKTQTRQSIQAAADAAGVGMHVRFLGVITDSKELACAFECASLHVFPVRSIPGDPEGFGMVAIEAAAHGLPTVAFASGGVIESVANGQSGELVAPGDYLAFSTAVRDCLAANKTLPPGCHSFAQKFYWPVFGRKLFALCLPREISDENSERQPYKTTSIGSGPLPPQ